MQNGTQEERKMKKISRRKFELMMKYFGFDIEKEDGVWHFSVTMPGDMFTVRFSVSDSSLIEEVNEVLGSDRDTMIEMWMDAIRCDDDGLITEDDVREAVDSFVWYSNSVCNDLAGYAVVDDSEAIRYVSDDELKAVFRSWNIKEEDGNLMQELPFRTEFRVTDATHPDISEAVENLVSFDETAWLEGVLGRKINTGRLQDEDPFMLDCAEQVAKKTFKAAIEIADLRIAGEGKKKRERKIIE